MYELIPVTERSYYIQSPAKIGLVKLDGQDVCLIDSGSDKDAGRKVRQILDANSWRLTAIYNTHSNAGHMAATTIYRGRPGAKSTLRGLTALLPATLSWSRPFCAAAIPLRSCGTNSSWPRRAMPRS